MPAGRQARQRSFAVAPTHKFILEVQAPRDSDKNGAKQSRPREGHIMTSILSAQDTPPLSGSETPAQLRDAQVSRTQIGPNWLGRAGPPTHRAQRPAHAACGAPIGSRTLHREVSETLPPLENANPLLHAIKLHACPLLSRGSAFPAWYLATAVSGAQHVLHDQSCFEVLLLWLFRPGRCSTLPTTHPLPAGPPPPPPAGQPRESWLLGCR